MTIECRLQPGLVGFQGAGYDADLIEAIVVDLDQSQNFTAGPRQLLLGPNHVYDGQFDQFRCSSSRLLPNSIFMGLC
ncbi:MAG: hypothetical protein JW394_0385 [Nitrospira sp.]|nr:hypothetical protein [Nitrospira sp.]